MKSQGWLRGWGEGGARVSLPEAQSKGEARVRGLVRLAGCVGGGTVMKESEDICGVGVGGDAHEHTRGHESLSRSHPGVQATRGSTLPVGSLLAFFSFFFPSSIQKIFI